MSLAVGKKCGKGGKGHAIKWYNWVQSNDYQYPTTHTVPATCLAKRKTTLYLSEWLFLYQESPKGRWNNDQKSLGSKIHLFIKKPWDKYIESFYGGTNQLIQLPWSFTLYTNCRVPIMHPTVSSVGIPYIFYYYVILSSHLWKTWHFMHLYA